MSWIDPQRLHRTLKLELDDGRADSVEQAAEIAGRYVIQIAVGDDVAASATRQTILLTAVNAARRAFLGGVRVYGASDEKTTIRWGHGRSIAEAVTFYGGTIVETLTSNEPTIVIGSTDEQPLGSIVIFPTWQNWSGGVVDNADAHLLETTEFPLAGVLAGGFAVSEAFQHVRGYALAGRRPVGLSLWRPDLPWRDPQAFGPPCRTLPISYWLLGLGHLGQAYGWAIGALPYSDTEPAHLMLQDYDVVAEANESTGMLCASDDVETLKTRVVAARLEEVGFTTHMCERRFDNSTRRSRKPAEKAVPAEPGMALAGFDDPAPRRLLEGADFDLVVDGGLGGGRQTYLDIDVHTFPSGLRASETWPERRPKRLPESIDQPAYSELRERLAEEGGSSGEEIACGVLRIAGQSIGAAFVGCVAAAIVLSETLRMIAGGKRYQVISLSLRSPHHVVALENEAPGPPVNPGFYTL
jgi:hypothetical protein